MPIVWLLVLGSAHAPGAEVKQDHVGPQHCINCCCLRAAFTDCVLPVPGASTGATHTAAAHNQPLPCPAQYGS
jgi:hypothetical protein